MSKPIIKINGLSKRYRIGVKEQGYKTFREAIMDGISAPVRNLAKLRRLTEFKNNPSSNDEEDVIWALKNVSFEVNEGEVLGIIGRNGAGKTTLLKILSRITEPTSGCVEIHGRLSSLLEVGTGFHPELTGRENIFLNGAILGMRKREIEKKFDEIVNFSGIEKFIDTPIKRYSSGMYVRLAFAVAAHLEPEILLVDEVLAVGDVAFQRKCLGKMDDVAREGRTVLFVSHNMAAIRNLCRRTLLLDSGTLVLDTNTERAIAEYLDENLTEGAVAYASAFEGKIEGVINRNAPTIRFRKISLLDQQGLLRNTFQSDEEIRVSVTYECLISVHDLRVIVQVVDKEDRPILTTQNIDDANDGYFYRQEPGVYQSSCTIPPNTFGEKRFYISVHLQYPKAEHLVLNKVLSFEVEFKGYNNVQYGSNKQAWIRPRLNWLTQSLAEKEVAIDR